jgi:hypothetical protein
MTLENYIRNQCGAKIISYNQIYLAKITNNNNILQLQLRTVIFLDYYNVEHLERLWH